MDLQELNNRLSGEIKNDNLSKAIYATDASIYRELPLAVAFPKSTEDIQELIRFAKENDTFLIPRTAGTSLAGQCVGEGIVVDVSRYMNQVLQIDVDRKRVWVQPGVVRDELNRILEPTGLFFAPNTSTSNRAMVGGMFGNNSCGTTSIQYGSTREHVISAEVILSDGSVVMVGDMSEEELQKKMDQTDLEGSIYHSIVELLSDDYTQQQIAKEYPDAKVKRRNQGYAIDMLLEMLPFNSDKPFNLCSLLAGSEGTLAFTTRLCLHLEPLPKPQRLVIGAHFKTLSESMYATQIAMKYEPTLCELMDDILIACTEGQPTYEKYRNFVEGNPKAILLVEFRADTVEEIAAQANGLIETWQRKNLGFYYPILYGSEAENAFLLRKAGLGLISNIKGDAKPIACIEDTAVSLDVLPDYIADFEKLVESHGQTVIFYAHAGAGELHLRPLINLKTAKGVEELYTITSDTADLVKRYRGTLSGEHGDGRVRAAFLEKMIGPHLYAVCERVKGVFDPEEILNKGKIVRAKPMDTDLRYQINEPHVEFDQAFDYYPDERMMDMIERCNGTGDCRRLATNGATMCPSYMATLDESATTRARANALREFMKNGSSSPDFSNSEVIDVLDLCVSCKACKSECPSNVDMALLKSEYQYQYYKAKGWSRRDQFFGQSYSKLKGFRSVAFLANTGMSLISPMLKNYLGISAKRQLPKLDSTKITAALTPTNKKGEVYLFQDEFLDLYERSLFNDTMTLLTKLGYQVTISKNLPSGRSEISKSMLSEAQKIASQNVQYYSSLISSEIPLVGIEPSAILTFRDEYPRLLRGEQQKQAKDLSKKCFTIEEFIAAQIDADKISSSDFYGGGDKIYFHSHCHQKVLSDPAYSIRIMELPQGNQVVHIPSACCGMAGSFGYEKEHYDVSVAMAKLVLIPTIQKTNQSDIIAASGFSCRHQIKDLTERQALHPVQVLLRYLS